MLLKEENNEDVDVGDGIRFARLKEVCSLAYEGPLLKFESCN
jgi:hypothetical protein